MQIEEIATIIEKLNTEMWQQMDEHDESPHLVLIASPHGIIIDFLDNRIWYDGDDMRECGEDDYEPLEDYLRREITATIKRIGIINLVV
jgi:hypothetical protein